MTIVNGVPTHVLLLHFVVVLVPLTAFDAAPQQQASPRAPDDFKVRQNVS